MRAIPLKGKLWLFLPPVAAGLAFIAIPGLAWAAGPAASQPHVPTWIHVIERFFLVLTAGVLAFGILHVEIELLHWGWNWLTRMRSDGSKAPSAKKEPEGPMVPRFDVHQRIQHLVLMVSFIVLAVTGLPQKFYRSEPFETLIVIMGGMDVVRLVHRVAAFVMIADGIYHMVYLVPGLVTLQGGRPKVSVTSALEMIPNRKDFTDFFHMMGYFLGTRPEPPKFGRYSYLQKFDYWAVGWGLVIMTVSGLIMMLPAIGLFSPATAAVAASLTAHSDEAILATGWILIVHLYHAHLSPRVFPFNTTIFTGYISSRQLKEEHALDYQRWVASLKEMPEVASDKKAARRRDR